MTSPRSPRASSAQAGLGRLGQMAPLAPLAALATRPSEHIGYLKAMGRFFKDKNGSKLGKLFVFLTIAYVVWPLDFVPDVVPIVGWLDDLGLATVAMGYLTRVAMRYREEALHPV